MNQSNAACPDSIDGLYFLLTNHLRTVASFDGCLLIAHLEGQSRFVPATRHASLAAWEVRGERRTDSEIPDTRDLSKILFVYQGGSSYDDLAGLARVGGLDSIKNEGNRREWVEKVWT